MDDFEDLNPDNARRGDPFRMIDLTLDYVDAAAGKQKTRTAIKYAVTAAKLGRKTIFAMQTRDLVGEMVLFARSLDAKVLVDEITTEPRRPQYQKGTVQARIRHYIDKFANGPGRILFITQEGYYRVGIWPEGTDQFDLILDEAAEIVLSREPFQLPHSHWVLTSFLNINPVPTTLAERRQFTNEAPPEFTYSKERNTSEKTDESRLSTYELMLQPNSGSSDAEVEVALREGKRLLAKRTAWETWLRDGVNTANHDLAMTYYLLTAKPDYKQEDPLVWVKLRQQASQVDDIFKYLDPVATWALQDAALFANMEAWNNMVLRKPDFDQKKNKRHVTIIGFRRPDKLKAFNKVTVMSALFRYTLMYSVWTQLGVKFVPSRDIVINDQTTDLGDRRLNIYWLYDEGWSKRARDDSGGIEKVLNLIKQSGVVSEDAEVCILLNKPDEHDTNPEGDAKAAFPNSVIMPHNTKGQNRFRTYHKLLYLAALNPNTFDIHWLESVLGVNADQQRIARTGLEVYQTAMRTSLRDSDSTADVDIVVMDKAVAEWLVQWFEPSDQVSVEEIDSTGVIRRKKGIGGRPKLLGDRPQTQSERNRRSRAKKRQQQEEETQDQ